MTHAPWHKPAAILLPRKRCRGQESDAPPPLSNQERFAISTVSTFVKEDLYAVPHRARRMGDHHRGFFTTMVATSHTGSCRCQTSALRALLNRSGSLAHLFLYAPEPVCSSGDLHIAQSVALSTGGRLENPWPDACLRAGKGPVLCQIFEPLVKRSRMWRPYRIHPARMLPGHWQRHGAFDSGEGQQISVSRIDEQTSPAVFKLQGGAAYQCQFHDLSFVVALVRFGCFEYSELFAVNQHQKALIIIPSASKLKPYV